MRNQTQNQPPETPSQPPKSTKTTSTLLSLNSESKTFLTTASFDKSEQVLLQKRIKSLQKYSKSYLQLICALIASSLFSSLEPLANQKYIQTRLYGQPSDLATVDLFSSTMSSMSPLFGYLVDNFYPFKKRIGPYLVFAYLVGSVAQYSIWAFKQSKSSFILAISINEASNAFVKVLSQGLLVIKTKMDVEIFDLKEELKNLKKDKNWVEERKRVATGRLQHSAKRENIGIRLYTIFSIYTIFFQGASAVLAGYLIDSLSVEAVYLVAALPGLCMVLFILTALRERSQKKKFSGGRAKLFGTIKQFVGILFHPMLFLPIFLKLLTRMVPDSTEAIKFILINKGGWSYSKFGQVTAVNAFLATFVVIVLQKVPRNSSFEKLFLAGILATGYARLIEIPQMFPSIPLYLFFASFFSQSIFACISDLFTTIPIFGRLNTLVPDGFESTGATVVESLIAASGAVSLFGTKKELEYFGVVNGYYERLKAPLVVNAALCVLISYVCPLFLGRMREAGVGKR